HDHSPIPFQATPLAHSQSPRLGARVRVGEMCRRAATQTQPERRAVDCLLTRSDGVCSFFRLSILFFSRAPMVRKSKQGFQVRESPVTVTAHQTPESINPSAVKSHQSGVRLRAESWR